MPVWPSSGGLCLIQKTSAFGKIPHSCQWVRGKSITPRVPTNADRPIGFEPGIEVAIRAVEEDAFDVVEKDSAAADGSQFAGAGNQTDFGDYFRVSLHKDPFLTLIK